MRAGWIAVALLIAPNLGCTIGGEECAEDSDCGSDRECTRTGACVAVGSAVRIALRWTIAGRAPTPAAPGPCDGIAELEVVLRGDGIDPQRYRPVPCELGRTVYDKMPPLFRTAELISYDAAGDEIAATTARLAPGADSEVTVDLAPAELTAHPTN